MTPTATPTISQKTTQQVEAEYSALTATFKVAARILAIRLFLFLSLIGSFALSLIAISNQTVQSAWIVVIYACVTTLPLTVLEWKGRSNGG